MLVILLIFFRAQGYHQWYHYCTPEKGFGSFLGEMPGAVHNVSNAHQFMCVALLLTDHLSKTLPRQLKLTNQKTLQLVQREPGGCQAQR